MIHLKINRMVVADIVGECKDALGSKVAAGIENMVTDLHAKMPASHIIVMAILPKVRRPPPAWSIHP